MFRSLRATLLLWYTVVLTILIVVFAGTVTYQYWQSLLLQVDAELLSATNSLASGITPDIDGTFDLSVPSTLRDTAPGESAPVIYYAVWNARGQLVDQSERSVTLPEMPPPGVFTRLGRREVVVDAAGEARILAGRSLAPTYAAVRTLGLGLASSGALVLILSLIGGFVLAGRALAPVARISRTAGAMIGGDLDARIPVKGTASELEQVARALNEAFDRMRRVADHQRQFTADASHELRTPLATVRAEFDWALSRPRSAAEYKASIEKGRKAVVRMTELADRLLALVRPGSGNAVERTIVDLGVLVESAIELLSPLAAAHEVTIRTELQHARVSGVPSLLVDAFSNLLKNAIEYNHPGGEVVIRVSNDRQSAIVSVQDSGVGISQEDLPHIFERFYRADRSRTRGGAGLGLAIVHSIVEEHGGSVACANNPGAGTEFTVRLPLALDQASAAS